MKTSIYSKIMADLFRQLVQHNELFERRKEGIYFILEFNGTCFGYEKDGNTWHPGWERAQQLFAHILIIRQYSVYVAITTSHSMPSVDEFENTSNHDTGWVNDGIDSPLCKVFYRVYEDIYSCTPEEHTPIPALANIKMDLNHGLFSSKEVFKHVKIDKERDPDSFYHYVLTSLEVVEK